MGCTVWHRPWLQRWGLWARSPDPPGFLLGLSGPQSDMDTRDIRGSLSRALWSRHPHAVGTMSPRAPQGSSDPKPPGPPRDRGWRRPQGEPRGQQAAAGQRPDPSPASWWSGSPPPALWPLLGRSCPPGLQVSRDQPRPPGELAHRCPELPGRNPAPPPTGRGRHT